MTDFAYDGPIFLVPLSPSYPSSPVPFNPSNAKATFVQNTRMLFCWYSLDSSRGVLSDEYPFARVSVILSGFLHHFILAKFATSGILKG